MNRTMHSSGRALAHAMFAFLSAAAMLLSPSVASAQGSLVVTVTSPTSGSTVSDTITVSASVSPLTLVQGVQFTLDGANLGAEDRAAPYSIPWNTRTAPNGSHTLRAVARNLLGLQFTSNPVTVTALNDFSPPTVAITSPTSGSTVTGTVSVAASASDDVGVVGVQFQLDGAALGAEDTAAPYSVAWNTSTAAIGNHALTAVARDAAGNSTLSTAVTVSVPDIVAPTASLTAPASGATVSGTITIAADAADNVGVAGVQFQSDGVAVGAEDTTSPYSVSWDTTTAANAAHTLSAVARDAAGNSATAFVTVTVSNAAFAPGDVFVSLVDGRVQWRRADGTLGGTLTGVSDGQASSAAFDAAGRLYVPHWWGSGPGIPGNLVVRFGSNADLLGTFGSGYNSNPSSLTFDAAGNVYVGQADDSGDIRKFDPEGNFLATFDVPTVNRGTDHIDLGADGCTMFYTSRSLDVLRFNVCTNTPMPRFNVEPLPFVDPGEVAYHVRVLPDGGVLVANSRSIVRLDASGNQVQLYFAPGEPNFWGGVDHAGDGTFWASNAWNGNIYRFDLASGAIVAGFNTGTGNLTAAGVAVKP